MTAKKACFTTSKCKDICMSALIKLKTCYIMECMFLKLSAWKSNFQKKKKERKRNNSSQTEKFSTVNFTVIYQQLKKEKQTGIRL